MARPLKQTVDYFPHDTDASVNSRTLKILENRFGNDGYTFWYKLLELLGRKDGHYIDFSDEDGLEYLASETKIKDIETVKVMLGILVKRGSIDKELYEQKVIWCQSFVDGVADAYRNRKTPLPQKPKLNTAINPVTTPDNAISYADNPHIKLNKTKLNKKRGGKALKQKFGEFLNVFLTTEEYGKLVTKFGQPGTEARIEELSVAIESKGYRYHSHYATILNWAQRDKKGGISGTHKGHSRELKPRNAYKTPEEHRRDDGGN